MELSGCEVCRDRTAIPEKHVLKIYFINDVLTL